MNLLVETIIDLNGKGIDIKFTNDNDVFTRISLRKKKASDKDTIHATCLVSKDKMKNEGGLTHIIDSLERLIVKEELLKQRTS